MCGIAGIYSKESVDRLEIRIDKMNDAIFHRGPDSGAFYTFEHKVALGHRRLSIIDLREIANQPMHSNDGHFHLIFNGEIYNFQEIKAQLNYEFNTDSDTEVIIAAVQEKGIDWFLTEANGMFAFALYNSETGELFIVRDRMGIKPLFYYNDGTHFIFSSEIKGILSSGLVKAEFNEMAVDEYLGNRYVRAPYTFFKNIYQIHPGTYITLKEDLSHSESIFWELPKNQNFSEDYDEEQLTEAFDKELTKAIKYRLIADVPLGAYLSGGVDSSLITAITVLNKKDKVNTYTIGFSEMNEFEYSEIIAEKYDTEHHEIVMRKEDYLKRWEDLIKYKDAPLGVPNEIPLAVMSSKLKEKITVVLSGEGADELMGGYGRIFRSAFDYENEATDQSFYDYFINQYEYVPRSLRDDLISTPKDYREIFDKELNEDFSSFKNEENIFNFFHKYHVKGLLQRVDITTMQTSVEARVPFLDHKLIEFAYNKIPYGLKLKWNSEGAKREATKQNSSKYSEVLDTPKYLLRKVSYKYLPEEIIERKKVGFPVPLTEWFENLEEMALELLSDVFWLKKGVVIELIEKSKVETRAGQVLWMFLNIELFKKQYFEKEWRW